MPKPNQPELQLIDENYQEIRTLTESCCEKEFALVYPALNQTEKDILLAMIAWPDNSSAAAMNRFFRKTNLRTLHNLTFSIPLVKATLARLRQIGLVSEPDYQGSIPISRFENLTLICATADPDQKERAKAILEAALLEHDHKNRHRWQPVPDGDVKANLRNLYFLNNFKALEELVMPFERSRYQSFHTPGMQIDLSFMLDPVDRERWSQLSEEIKHKSLQDGLEESYFNLSPVDETLKLIDELKEKPQHLLRLAGEISLLRGKRDEVTHFCNQLRQEAERIREEAVDYLLDEKRAILADARALEAATLFFSGRTKDSITAFEDSINIEKGPSRKKKFCPRGMCGVFFQLALCERAGTLDFARAIQVGNWGIELAQTKFTSVLDMGCAITTCLSGKASEEKQNVINLSEKFLAITPSSFNVLLFALIMRLSGVSKNKYWTVFAEKMDQLADDAAATNWNILALEAAELHAGLSKERTPTMKARIKALRGKIDIESPVPFTSRLTPLDRWELSLTALEGIAAKHGSARSTAKKKTAARKEVVWIISVDFEEWGNELYMVPKLRSISAKGKATKGRNIALKTLKEKSDSISALSEQDCKVIPFIKTEHSWGGHSSYIINDTRSLAALVGHPLLFADPDTLLPLVLRKGKIRVDISDEKSGQFTAKMIPPLEVFDNWGMIEKNGKQEMTVYPLTPSIKALGGIFSGDSGTLTLPIEGRDRFFNAISSLAGDVDISADGDIASIGGDDAAFTQIKGDAEPRLRLIPEGDGLAARMFVRPIPDSESVYNPGEGKDSIFGMAGNSRVQALRDLKKESLSAKNALENCPSLLQHRGEQADLWAWRFETPLDCLQLLRDLNDLNENGKATLIVEWPEGESFKLHGVVSAQNINGSLGGESDWLTLSGDVKVNEDLVFSMRNLLDLSASVDELSGNGFIEIGKGQFLALTNDFKQQLEDIRALAQPGKGEKIKLPPLAALALEGFIGEISTKSKGKLWKQWIKRFSEAKEHNPYPPKTLKAELRPYQLDGYRWLSRLAKTGAGACLADDMGLGKTVQSLALLLERAELGPALVIAPTSVAANWVDETLKFAPTLNTITFGSGNREKQLKEAKAFDLIICTYGLLQREGDALASINWSTIILDEAQAIKNAATQRSKAARKLQADFRVVTTGTPVENRLSELHTLFQFLVPGFLGSWDKFRKQFADPIERHQDNDARNRLRRLIQPFLLRRMKSDVLPDLPSRTEINLHVELSDEERAFYEALRQRAVEELESGTSDEPGKGAIRILAELTRLRRACCHPVLVDKKAGKDLGSSKLAAFSETLDEILSGNHKVLVFSQFVDHLSLIRAELEKKDITYQYLDGSTPTKKRKQAVDDFQRGEGDVFLISLKAGGFGLNLTAADYVIHMDPWWNPATEDQASDRAHRIGQTRPVTIYRFITKGTIEEKIVKLHQRKRELAESLLAGTGDANARVSPEMLLDLIRE